MTTSTPAIRAFLSYSHADDDEFDVVEALASKLKAFVRGKSGRELEIFIDRESIGWGTNWRTSISGSVENATVFIPLLSANYLASAPCRDEFLAFHSKAETLGVTELLLPILVFRSALFDEGTTDEVAQIAEALQYKCIEDAMLAGYQSPEWLRCTKDLAESLLEAILQAETSLLATADERLPKPDDGDSDPQGVVDPDPDLESAGLAELMQRLESAIDRMSQATEILTPAIEALGEVPEQVGDLPDSPTPKQMNAWAFRLASGFREPAAQLESGGRQLFDSTKELDETLLTLKNLAETSGVPEVRDPITAGRRQIVSQFGDLSEVAAGMEDLLDSMRPAEVLSVPLRKSLQPARRGLTSVRDAIRLIESWRDEFPEPGTIEGS